MRRMHRPGVKASPKNIRNNSSAETSPEMYNKHSKTFVTVSIQNFVDFRQHQKI